MAAESVAAAVLAAAASAEKWRASSIGRASPHLVALRQGLGESHARSGHPARGRTCVHHGGALGGNGISGAAGREARVAIRVYVAPRSLELDVPPPRRSGACRRSVLPSEMLPVVPSCAADEAASCPTESTEVASEVARPTP